MSHIFVGNLPIKFNSYDVEQLFKTAGVTVTIKKMGIKRENDTSYAFLEVRHNNDFGRAIQLNGKMLSDGRNIEVRKHDGQLIAQ